MGQNGGNAPYWMGASEQSSPLPSSGTIQPVEIDWTDVGGPLYLTQQSPMVTPPAFNPAAVQSILFHVFTKTSATTPYGFCVANLALIPKSSTTTGTGGTPGSTGAGGVGGNSVACAAATSRAIAFDTDAGTPPVGTPYDGADTGLMVPTYDTSTDALVVSLDTGPPSTQFPYAYIGLPFNACVNASAYTGVQFTIGGTLSAGCTIEFITVDREHSTIANHGTCPDSISTTTGCYGASKVFALPAIPTTVKVAFADQTGGGAAPTSAPVDPGEILDVQWQVNIPASVGAGGCTGSFTIDNVDFY